MSESKRDLSLYDGELRGEDGFLVRRWLDEYGYPHEARVKIKNPYWPSGVEASRTNETRAYHREYYRKVRRYRDGRTPRVPDEEPTETASEA